MLAFWLAYILTRPLGASTGDLLSQPRHDGGLGLGTTVTSVVFLGAILIVVVFLSVTKRDVTEGQPAVEERRTPRCWSSHTEDRRHARAVGRRPSARAARARELPPARAEPRRACGADRCRA